MRRRRNVLHVVREGIGCLIHTPDGTERTSCLKVKFSRVWKTVFKLQEILETALAFHEGLSEFLHLGSYPPSPVVSLLLRFL
jgi:hypothetical protein